MSEYHSITTSETFNLLKTDENGLNEEEAKERLQEHGYNELPKENKFTAIIILLDQFKDPLILMLIFAGLLSLLLHEHIESIAIFSIILLNAILGFIQEYKAEKAIESLQEISAPTARVVRNGNDIKIPAREVVPGDILFLEAGDIVPADSRLFEVAKLQIDEAALTGESIPSTKITERFSADISVADQENMAFQGTVVTYGQGKSIVTETGTKTEFGKVAKALQDTKKTETPLQKKFGRLARQIGIICVFLVIIVFTTGLLRDLPFARLVLLCLTLTVSTIPNSLPLVVTVGLSRGDKELAEKNMLVKKLPAVEGLGSATFICTDKTGTLTKNQMTVTRIYHNHEKISVTGSGYKPSGEFLKDGKVTDPKELELLLRIGYLCNNSKLEENEKFKIIGDPTEGSLLVLARKAGFEKDHFLKGYSLINKFPFDSERKRMSAVCIHQNKTESFVKGAPDLLLQKCNSILENGKIRNLTEKDKDKILSANKSFAEKALRVLALAHKKLPHKKNYSIDEAESELVFVGLVGMIDPAREEVKDAIKKCRKAGIQVMVITGDHAITTKAIADNIGLLKPGDLVLTGEELEKMNDKELVGKVQNIRIIARAMPLQKVRIVEALQKKGHIVAMTGDGVNDAPALKKADIGIAMGITGTDVTKEVAEAILTDDNFASIVNAIETGRNIYDKLIKSAKFFLSCNFGELTSVLSAVLLGLPLPLLPLQILLINMLTDNFPALGLGFEKSEEGIMARPPRDPNEPPLTRKSLTLIVVLGLIMGIGTMLMFFYYKTIDLSLAQTVAFTTLVMFQMFAVMSSRTLHFSLKNLNPFTNLWLSGAVTLSVLIQVAVIYFPPFQNLFGTVPLTMMDWGMIIGISVLGYIIMETSKFFLKSEFMEILEEEK